MILTLLSGITNAQTGTPLSAPRDICFLFFVFALSLSAYI